ncbi:MAG: hypothetical protein SLAVMIC_00360 [uncultured marine phage]|uniref:Uncharacterized protein n=1 Tax=uncultured marine phage TaxID=707152 RepID=A0A8D9FS30_9VIRU|nr:MAG: hypothetical protein SLAVMIC_00360 [uncultured marine phage]
MKKINLYKCKYPGYEDIILLGYQLGKSDYFGTVVGLETDIMKRSYSIGYCGGWGCEFEILEESVTIQSKNKLYVNDFTGDVLIKTNDKYGGQSYYTMISDNEIQKIKIGDITMNDGKIFTHKINGEQHIVTEYRKCLNVKFVSK